MNSHLQRRFVRMLILACVIASTLVAGGCKKKVKAKITLPPAARQEVPTIMAVLDEPLLPEIEIEEPVEEPSTEKPKRTPRPRRTPRRPAVTAPATETASEAPATAKPETVPPSPPIQVGPAHPPAQHGQSTTTQLLDSTEANLRRIQRQLSGGEQAMLNQIRAFMDQSRSAIKDGDMVRAYNLAMKAHLLSDELVGR